MQKISLVTSDAPTMQDACVLARYLKGDTGIAVGRSNGRMVIQFDRGTNVIELPLTGPKQVLDAEAAALFAQQLQDRATDLIDLFDLNENFLNTGSHLLMVMYRECDELNYSVRLEIREELERQGFVVPAPREEEFLSPAVAVC